MAQKRKKQGRPRTGRDPMIGVRLPASGIKKIGKIAEAFSTNRSGAIRWLLERTLDSGLATILLRQGRWRGMTGRIVHSDAEELSDARVSGSAW
jgi:hypothetical protein